MGIGSVTHVSGLTPHPRDIGKHKLDFMRRERKKGREEEKMREIEQDAV